MPQWPSVLVYIKFTQHQRTSHVYICLLVIYARLRLAPRLPNKLGYQYHMIPRIEEEKSQATPYDYLEKQHGFHWFPVNCPSHQSIRGPVLL